MIKKSLLVLVVCLFNSSVFGMTFDDAVEICKSFYQKIDNPKNDGVLTFGESGRINVQFTYANNNVVCSVDVQEKEIVAATFGSRFLSRNDIMRAKLNSIALKKEKDSILNGGHIDFLNSAKKIITAKFKDPDSVQFRNLFLSNKAFPTLCGELNAKNSYGGYVGYKGFFYNSVSSIIDDGNDYGNGYLYSKLYKDRCGERFLDIN